MFIELICGKFTGVIVDFNIISIHIYPEKNINPIS